MGRAGTIWARHGTSPLKARPVVRYVGRGPVTVKKFYFWLAPARTGTSPRGPARGLNAPFLCFLPLNCQKQKHIKHGAGLREAQAQPVDKFLKFQPRPGTARHSCVQVRHGPPFTQAREPLGKEYTQACSLDALSAELVNRPDPCPPLHIQHAKNTITICWKSIGTHTCGFSLSHSLYILLVSPSFSYTQIGRTSSLLGLNLDFQHETKQPFNCVGPLHLVFLN